MDSGREFLAEVNEIFGFYFDIGMACHFARDHIRTIQRDGGIADDSPFSFSSGPPSGTPEQEIEKSLHATTVSAVLARLAEGGYDAGKAAETAVVFTYHIWEEKYRRTFIGVDGKPAGRSESNILGDLRLLRNSIIHNKGIAALAVSRCKVITRFKPGDQIALLKDDICTIIEALRSEFGGSAQLEPANPNGA